MTSLPVFANLVKKALVNLNVEKAAQFSALDHHVVGMDYLNFHRSDKLTLKLYLIEGDVDNGDGYLVAPHTHRYEFSSYVLSGGIQNVLFEDTGRHTVMTRERNRYYLHEFDADTAGQRYEMTANLRETSAHFYGPGETYFTDTKQIHTLRTQSRPTLLALSQFSDLRDTTAIYLRQRTDAPLIRTCRKPTLEQTEAMRVRCLQLIEEQL